jgi:nucleoside-diphosphate-sugar epimerase
VQFVKLTPFTIRMLSIHRYFDVSAARMDLGYRPVVSFEEGWAATVAAIRARPETGALNMQ